MSGKGRTAGTAGLRLERLNQHLSNHLPWALLFLGIFLATHWQEVSSPTLNVDDWALVLDPIQQGSLSRPGWDLVYGGLFQGSFSPFLGWMLAGFSLYACALAAAVPLPVLTPPWVCQPDHRVPHLSARSVQLQLLHRALSAAGSSLPLGCRSDGLLGWPPAATGMVWWHGTVLPGDGDLPAHRLPGDRNVGAAGSGHGLRDPSVPSPV